MWETFLHRFGYLAVFVGTFLEGETILVLSGFFASRRAAILKPAIIILVAFSGAFLGHVFWFWIGRTKGAHILHRHPNLERHMARALKLFEDHGPSAVFISQYLYGLRIVSAVMFGISHIKTRTFLLYQALSCLIWATLVTLLGFYFGRAVQKYLGQAAGIITIVVLGIVVFAYHKMKDRRQDAQPGASVDKQSEA
ncbi:MAG TPA: DedA family protein [Thermoanaerobaculia bacterium]|nr:DedA family protein [Thermoanaerobaculia bacterium]